MAALIYGGGLRVSECCELRIKDLDFDQGLIFVRGSKGAKDRSTLLAELGRDELRAHLQRVEVRYRADRASGLASVWMPEALERKYPNAGRELGWFRVFPSHTLSTDPRAGIVRRHKRLGHPRAIQELAGHANFTTTQRYMHLSPSAIEGAIRMLESPGVPAGRGNVLATGNGEFVNLSSVTT